MIPIALSNSTSILVGNKIGSQQLTSAHFLAKISTYTGLMWALLSTIAVLVFEKLFITLFSTNDIVNGFVD